MGRKRILDLAEKLLRVALVERLHLVESLQQRSRRRPYGFGGVRCGLGRARQTHEDRSGHTNKPQDRESGMYSTCHDDSNRAGRQPPHPVIVCVRSEIATA